MRDLLDRRLWSLSDLTPAVARIRTPRFPMLRMLLRVASDLWDARSRRWDWPATLIKEGRRSSADNRRVELARVREREPDALDRFFREHFDRVFSFAARLLGDRAAAEDVTQEVFFRAYRGIDRLDPERDPAAWLLTITANVCRDLWRSQAHRMDRHSDPLFRDSGEPRHFVDPQPDAHTSRLSGEQTRRVQSALNSLPEALREVVLLRDYQNLSHEEIAEGLGISLVAARKRYSRALAQLAQVLSVGAPS